MNIKRLKFGFIIGLAGIVGATTCGIMSVPYAIETTKNAYEKAKEIKIEDTINLSEYSKINRLVINGEGKNITINKSETGYNYIEYNTTKRNPTKIDVKFNDKEKELALNIKSLGVKEEVRFKKGMPLKNFIDEILINDYENSLMWYDGVSLYLTDAVDMEINNIYGGFDISDSSILKDELIFNNKSDDDYYLPENHNLKRLIINSEGYVDLDSEDLRGIENVSVNANKFRLSNHELSKNFEKSDTPAKNVYINAKDINLSFNDKLAENIEIGGARDVEIYGNTDMYPSVITTKNIGYYEDRDDNYDEYNEESQNNISLNNLFVGKGDMDTATKINIKSNIERLMLDRSNFYWY